MTKKAGLASGVLLFLVLVSVPTLETFRSSAAGAIAASGSSMDPEVLAASMQSVLALVALMVVWWFTEAVPLPVTALLPAVILPLMHATGLANGAEVSFTAANVLRHYAHPVIYLFFGGFLLAGAMQKWKLDRRFTLWFLTRGNIAGDSRKILLGVMCATAFLSMWISNTATAAMMIPVGLGLLAIFEIEPGHSRYGTALMLGIGWSASVGGVGTIIGSPPNGIAVGILQSTFADTPDFHPVTFLGWMKFGVPFVAVMIPVVWMVLLKAYPPEIIRLSGERGRMLWELRALGPLSGGEKRTIAVVLSAVVLWISNPFWGDLLPAGLARRLEWVDEYSIGLLCGLSLFVIPVDLRAPKFVLDWGDTKYVEWGTLILFGGGIALSDAMFKSGIASWIAVPAVGLFGYGSPLLMLIVLVVLVDFLTEVTSNTAVTSMMVPIVITVAMRSGNHPVMMAVAVAVAASMAFMLPVATPPNALVYGTGRVPLRAMIRTGFFLDLAGWVVTIVVVYVIAEGIFGVFSGG
jgi:sodium-dependent dicarboxylate transporter 2/3/5